MLVKNENRTKDEVVIISILKRTTSYREAMLLIVILLGSFIVSLLSPAFFTVLNLKTTALGFSTTGIVAIGMTIALVSGAIDLSVGSVFGLCGILTAKLYHMGMNIWAAAGIAIAIGLLCGLFNGILVGKVGINSLITTLAMMGIARGAAMYISQGRVLSLRTMPDSFHELGAGEFLGMPVMILIFIAITIVAAFFFKKTAAMRKVFYVGSNEQAARFTGINVANVRIAVFLIVAVLSAVAGIISISRFSVAVPTGGTGLEMATITAVVIGGASLRGGEGTVLGSVLGIILIGLINNILVLLNISVYLQQLIGAVIMISAVTLDHYNKKRLESLTA